MVMDLYWLFFAVILLVLSLAWLLSDGESDIIDEEPTLQVENRVGDTRPVR